MHRHFASEIAKNIRLPAKTAAWQGVERKDAEISRPAFYKTGRLWYHTVQQANTRKGPIGPRGRRCAEGENGT